MWQGADLYNIESQNAETLERFGQGTPDDWMERNIYSPHSVAGIATMMVINLALFGFIGMTIWAVQMMWIPFFAAGVINGIGHYWGYRSFQAEDASRNIVPWGILIGGEELHNNHHAYPSSAQLSNKWWEFDIGWMYIRIMETLGLAQSQESRAQGPAGHRQDPMRPGHAARGNHAAATMCWRAMHARSSRPAPKKSRTCKARAVRVDRSMVKRWLHNDQKKFSELESERMKEVLSNSKTLHTVYSMRQELTTLWQRSTANKEQLVRQLEDWCHRAEASGIVALRDFSQRLRRYQLARA